MSILVDAASEYLELAPTGFGAGGVPYTIMAQFFQIAARPNYRTVFYIGPSAGLNTGGVFYGQNPNDTTRLDVEGAALSSGSVAIPTGRWVNLAVTYNAGVHNYYIDGAVNSTVTRTFTINPQVLRLGIETTSTTQYPDAYYDNLLMYSGIALTPDQVMAQGRQRVPINRYGLYAWYPMLPGNGNLLDRSGNQRVLTPYLSGIIDGMPAPMRWSPRPIIISAPAAAGSASVGSAAITEADDTVSATGTLPIVGTAGISEAADTVASAGKLALDGTAAITEANDTVASTGVLPIVGSASITEAADTVTSTGTLPIVGTAGITEAADTLTSAGTLPIVGQAAITEGADTSAATGVLPIIGAASITEAADTLTATGGNGLTGQLAVTEADDAVSAAGVLPIVGSAGITESADTLSATGALPIVGQTDATEADDTLTATGNGPGALNGQASITEADDTVVATGTINIAAIAAIAEQADTLIAAAVLSISGQAAIQEADDTCAATQTVVRHFRSTQLLLFPYNAEYALIPNVYEATYELILPYEPTYEVLVT